MRGRCRKRENITIVKGDTEYLVLILRYFPQEVFGINTRIVSNWAPIPNLPHPL